MSCDDILPLLQFPHRCGTAVENNIADSPCNVRKAETMMQAVEGSTLDCKSHCFVFFVLFFVLP
jgi:hypothetical protein